MAITGRWSIFVIAIVFLSARLASTITGEAIRKIPARMGMIDLRVVLLISGIAFSKNSN